MGKNTGLLMCEGKRIFNNGFVIFQRPIEQARTFYGSTQNLKKQIIA